MSDLNRHELIDGRVYGMTGGTQNHSAIKLNMASLIKMHLRGGQGRVFDVELKSIDLRVFIEQLYEEIVFEA